MMSSEKRGPILETIPYDPRFPNQNQTRFVFPVNNDYEGQKGRFYLSRNCYQNYLDYHRCRKIKGEDYKPCEWYKRVYTALCPNAWHEKWDEQREQGNFPGQI